MYHLLGFSAQHCGSLSAHSFCFQFKIFILFGSSNSLVVNDVLSFDDPLTRSLTCVQEGEEENVLTPDIINTVLQVDRHIRDFTVRSKNRTKYNYNDLCAHAGKECFKDPLLELIQVRRYSTYRMRLQIIAIPLRRERLPIECIQNLSD